MRVSFLSNRVPWFGAHTGYEQLPSYVQAVEGMQVETLAARDDVLARLGGKVVSAWRRHGRVSQSDAWARFRLESALRRDPSSIGHILYGEEHLPFWRDTPLRLRQRTVLTLHQPSSALVPEKVAALAALPHAIVLWQRELDWFRERLGGGAVHFVHHGVDVDFFTPAPEPPASEPARVLYVGVHLRNTRMLARIVPRLHRMYGDVQFDFLVPASRRSEPHLATLAGHPNIQWHSNVDDEGLRALYRRAQLLLLPLNDSGANTAVVEALACGLPIVTTHVGGIGDYGGGTVFPTVENNDDDGMLALAGNYLDSPANRDKVSRACRVLSENRLAWPVVARKHAEIYRRLMA